MCALLESFEIEPFVRDDGNDDDSHGTYELSCVEGHQLRAYSKGAVANFAKGERESDQNAYHSRIYPSSTFGPQ